MLLWMEVLLVFPCDVRSSDGGSDGGSSGGSGGGSGGGGGGGGGSGGGNILKKRSKLTKNSDFLRVVNALLSPIIFS